jgi:hypothetical protein
MKQYAFYKILGHYSSQIVSPANKRQWKELESGFKLEVGSHFEEVILQMLFVKRVVFLE